MADTYRTFAELWLGEREGIDFRVCVTSRNSSIAIIAPHGGWIEPGTSQIAAAMAGEAYHLYCFEGLRNRPHGDLHITSHRYDEPTCVALVRACDQVIAVHGKAGAEPFVDVGGLDTRLRDRICANLVGEHFAARAVASGDLAALHPENICNRSSRRMGAQLEVTRGLRNVLVADSHVLERFARAVRSSLRAP